MITAKIIDNLKKYLFKLVTYTWVVDFIITLFAVLLSLYLNHLYVENRHKAQFKLRTELCFAELVNQLDKFANPMKLESFVEGKFDSLYHEPKEYIQWNLPDFPESISSIINSSDIVKYGNPALNHKIIMVLEQLRISYKNTRLLQRGSKQDVQNSLIMLATLYIKLNWLIYNLGAGTDEDFTIAKYNNLMIEYNKKIPSMGKFTISMFDLTP